jgi:rod shape-determining protein MreC
MLHFFLKRKRIFFFFLLLVLCVTLITLGVDKKQKPLPAQTALQAIFSYPLSLTSWIVTTTGSLWSGYLYLVDVEKRNEALQNEMNMLLLENQQLREHFLENQRLKKLLDFEQQFAYTMLPAEIIGKDPSSWFKTILVNRGSEAGVQRGNGVICPLGVVGTVLETTLHSSKILLITDQNSAIDAIAQRSRVRGILEGQAENTCVMNYVVKNEDILAGDEIIASGLNAVFPRGIIIGRVAETDNRPDGFFKNIAVAPAVDFSKLNEVLIVLKEPADTEKE